MAAEVTRFRNHFQPIADAVARLDIDQEDRELVAASIADAISSIEPTTNATREWKYGWRHDLFKLLASDPLVPCAGFDRDGIPHDCPDGAVIRQAFHNSSNSDPLGRSAFWQQRAPYGEMRCVSCGARQFVPGFDEATQREAR